MRAGVGTGFLVLAALTLSGCGQTGEQQPAAQSVATTVGAPTATSVPREVDSRSTLRPDLMVVSPSTAEPGALVDLTFPEETGRGVVFVLQQEVDGAWLITARLFPVSVSAAGTPTWQPPDGDLAWADVGVSGPGPERAVLPPDLDPGNYRICTGNAGDPEFCAPVTIS